MAKRIIQIDNIFSGFSPSNYFSKKGQYQVAIGIDPDMPIDDSGATIGFKPSGVLRPTASSDFTGGVLNEAPYWIITNPKTTTSYVINTSPRLISYDSSLGSETNVGSISTGAGNGAAYYNNYIYVFGNTAVDRYGPLDGTPAITTGVWAGSTLGSQTALTDTTYPSTRGSNEMPNHVAHVHVDNKLYFADFKNGQGLIHFIKTTKGTYEGDTNDGSTYNALDLPFGFMPTAFESYGTDLVIAAIQSSSATINQGRSALFFWDTISASFYRQVWLPDPICSALKNNNGILYVWSGNLNGGMRLSAYAGGESIQQLIFMEEQLPPLAGAVDAIGERLVWGGHTTHPATSACVWAYGSKNSNFPKGLHNILATDSSGANAITTAVKYVNNNFARSLPLAGWTNDSDHGIDAIGTTYGTCYFHSEMFNVGVPFTVVSIRLPLGAAIAANMTIVPKIYLDDSSSSKTLTTINSTNFAGSQRVVTVPAGAAGKNNFYLELKWTGSVLLPVLLPITIELQTYGD